MQTMIHNLRKTKSCPCLLKLSLFVEISCLINLEESNYCVPPSVTCWCSRWGQIILSIWYTGCGKHKFLYFNCWNISECSKTLYLEIMFAIWGEPRAGTPEETWAQVITKLNLEMDINNRTPWNSPITVVSTSVTKEICIDIVFRNPLVFPEMKMLLRGS